MSEDPLEHLQGVRDLLDALEALDRAQQTLDLNQLRERHAQLEDMRARIDFELIVVESALRAAGAWYRPGRPRKAATHTPVEALEAHRRWKAGERSEWIEAGHRQYERDQKHNRRQTKA